MDDTQRTSTWRAKFRVHPFADKFPLMGDDELAALGADIVANGLKHPIVFWDTNKGTPEFQRFLIDGRNRLEAMERVGLGLDLVRGKERRKFIDGDPVAAIMSFNVHRRHLSQQDRADAIVAWIATIEADNKPGQAGPVSELKGGRGKRNPIKEKALAINAELPKEQQVSERTIKRAIARATSKPKAVNRSERGHTIMRRPMRPKSGPVYSARGIGTARQHYLRHAELVKDLDAEREIIDDALRAIDSKRALNGGKSKSRAEDSPL